MKNKQNHGVVSTPLENKMSMAPAWLYECGHPAPQPPFTPPSTEKIHYLSCPCTSTYSFDTPSPPSSSYTHYYPNRAYQDKHLHTGKFDGMTSQEDRYFHRSQSPAGWRTDEQLEKGMKRRRMGDGGEGREKDSGGRNWRM